MSQSQDGVISDLFDWFVSELLPIVEQNGTQEKFGYHGLYTHTAAAVFRGLDYATSLNMDPMPVVFACAFHDMARTDDEYNEYHGPNAVPIAARILDGFSNLTVAQRESILSAVKNHTTGRVAPDYVSACLWDADRTRLSWGYGFMPECFSTARARDVACGVADDYVAFMRRTISKYAKGKLADFTTEY